MNACVYTRQGETHELEIVMGGEELADDGDDVGSHMESEGARKRGKRGGKKRSQRAARHAADTQVTEARLEDSRHQPPARVHVAKEDDVDGLKGFAGCGACEKTVGARLRGEFAGSSDLVVKPRAAGALVSSRHPDILDPSARRVTAAELAGGVADVVAEAVALHPSLRASAVPHVILATGLHEHIGLLQLNHPILLAAAKVCTSPPLLLALY